MPADVNCVPGQAIPALADKPVALARTGGFPEQQGTVKLLATGRRTGAAPMEPTAWTAAAIEVTLPAVAPGDAPYYIEVESNGQSYTGLLDVRSPDDGSGYPPSRG